jgi:hypothetical protein
MTTDSKYCDARRYASLGLEELLCDDFFIRSTLHPDEGSERFWNGFLDEYPARREVFECAVGTLLATRERMRPAPISEEEMNAMRIRVEAIGRYEAERSGRLRRMAVRWSVAASVLAGVAGAALLVTLGGERRSDIVAFADSSVPAPDAGAGGAHLILSDDRVIPIDNTESEIRYDSAGITVDRREIPRSETGKYNQLVLSKGRRTTLLLADGTRMWVNGGSRVVYPVEFTDARREIFIDGEVFLDVTPDPRRQFVVHTRDIDVRVFGTSFNVSAYSEDTSASVVLVSGKVSVAHGGGKGEAVELVPDQMLYCTDGQFEVSTVDTRAHTSWIDGIYIYRNEPLGRVMARLSRYYGVKVSLDAASSALLCSGKLDLKDDIAEIISGIGYTAPITSVETDGVWHISIAR